MTTGCVTSGTNFRNTSISIIIRLLGNIIYELAVQVYKNVKNSLMAA